MTRIDTEKALKVFMASKDIGPAALRRLAERAKRERMSLAAVITDSAKKRPTRANRAQPAAGVLSGITDPARAAQSCCAELESEGFRLLVEGFEGYPRRLSDSPRDNEPYALFACGNPDMLAGHTVAVVGSREPGASSVEFVKELCIRTSQAGSVIVSGGARGIDSLAHSASVRRSGTVMVLPVGLRQMARMPAVSEVGELPGDRLCALSPFSPDAVWHDKYAIIRNRLIVALSEWVIAVDSRDFGGTWSSARFALEYRRPLFVCSDRSTGARKRAMEKLLRAGAIPLSQDAAPRFDELRAMADAWRSAPRLVQPYMFHGRKR